jgi:hypothetical protein
MFASHNPQAIQTTHCDQGGTGHAKTGVSPREFSTHIREIHGTAGRCRQWKRKGYNGHENNSLHNNSLLGQIRPLNLGSCKGKPLPIRNQSLVAFHGPREALIYFICYQSDTDAKADTEVI